MKHTAHFTASLRRYGTKPAIVDFGREGAAREITYVHLADRVESLARGLMHRGITAGERVGLMAAPSIDAIALALAAIRAKAILMPIDRQLENDSLAHIVRDSSPRIVFVGENERKRIEKLGIEHIPELVLLDTIDTMGASTPELPSPAAPDDSAVLFYTSGTTGPPKGVPLTNRNIAFQLETVAKARLVKEDDRVLLPLPLHHVYPLVIGIFVPLSMGLTLVLPASVTGPELSQALREGDVTVIIGVPRLYRALYEAIARRISGLGGLKALAVRAILGISMMMRRRLGVFAGGMLLHPLHKQFAPRLRVLACGGAALDADLFMHLEALGWRVAVGYGLTETAPLLTINPPGKAKAGSAGKTVAGVQLRIDTAAQSKKQKAMGEIQARGPNVFAGYRNLDEETAKAFTEDGWFRTGDLGYFDKDGYLFITGRVSTVIVTESGENVQPDEVEVHYEQHRFIREAGILQQQGKLVAVIVPQAREIAQESLSAEEAIRRAVNQQNQTSSSYKRITDYVISRSALPRTQLGKIRRQLLSEQHDTLKKETAAGAKVRRGPMPIKEMSESDRELLNDNAARKVWELLAHRFADRQLTPDASPQLDLGLDSLGWLELTLDIREQTGVEIDEEAIGRIETVRDLIAETAELAKSGITRGLDPFEHPEQALSAKQKKWLKPHNRIQRIQRRCLYWLNWIVMHAYFRISVRGRENLYAAEQYIITPNHASYLDSFVLAATVPYKILGRTVWAARTKPAFANPVNRFVVRLAWALPIEHGLSARSDMAIVVAALDRRRSLIWYPEGELEPENALLPFRAGIGLLLEHRPVPVIPTIIKGTRRAMPIGRIIARPGRIEITFGKPIAAEELVRKAAAHEKLSRRERIVRGLRMVMEELHKL